MGGVSTWTGADTTNGSCKGKETGALEKGKVGEAKEGDG